MPLARLLQQANEDDGMIGKVFADARKIRAHGNAEVTQRRRRANTRAHEKRRRMDAAERNDDLAPVKCFLLAADPGRDPGGATPLEHQAGDRGLGADLRLARRRTSVPR